jgi:uncharacterized protein
MKSFDYWVKAYEMNQHPEGGFYKEIYRSENSLTTNYGASRSLMTSIYFLITKGNFSAFHRIKSDELWSYHYGDALAVHIIDPDGNYSILKIGSDVENGEQLQGIVPAGSWFASEVLDGGNYSLVGCVVAPGFDFEDFELAKKSQLTQLFPQHDLVIEKLCKL